MSIFNKIEAKLIKDKPKPMRYAINTGDVSPQLYGFYMEEAGKRNMRLTVFVRELLEALMDAELKKRGAK